jgi:hypothetical protein
MKQTTSRSLRYWLVFTLLALAACTPAPPPPPATRPPAPTLGPTPTTSPPCAFAGAAPSPEPAPPLDAYRFEAPAVVFTSTSPLGVAGFLPDGQRLLLTHVITESQREYIEAYNLQSGDLQRYGGRRRTDVPFSTRPQWLGNTSLYAAWDGVEESLNRGAPSPGGIGALASPYFGTDLASGRAVFLPAEAPDRPEIYSLI